jgi:hypothetical protein
MKLSLKSQILQKVIDRGYITLNEILELAAEGHYEPWTAKRKAQELAQAGKITPEYDDKGHLKLYRLPNSTPEAQNKPQTSEWSPRHIKYQVKAKSPVMASQGQQAML